MWVGAIISNMNIKEVKEILSNAPSEAQIDLLKADNRAGVQKLLDSYFKRLEKLQKEKERFAAMTVYEQEAYAKGAEYVAGVDEAGRGPLAGPCVIAAVILPKEVFISGLNDSKQLSAKKRDALYDEIIEKALAITVNVVSVHNIDTQNIYRATQLGMAQVLEKLPLRPQLGLIDAMPVEAKDIPTRALVHGDALSVSIAAASIIAKVTRDRMMEALDKEFPQYSFAGNKGYGSQAHMDAIAQYGATEHHRRSYEPLKSMNLPPVAPKDNQVYVLK